MMFPPVIRLINPVIKKALLLSVTKCSYSAMSDSCFNNTCVLLRFFYSKTKALLSLSLPHLPYTHCLTLCSSLPTGEGMLSKGTVYICTCADSQLTEQTFGVKPAAVRHK